MAKNDARAGRAAGGPVAPGTAYTVGERGPEVLVKAATARPGRKATAKTAPAPAAPEPAPRVVGGIAIFGDTAVQDPTQAAMDAAVAEHNAAQAKLRAGS